MNKCLVELFLGWENILCLIFFIIILSLQFISCILLAGCNHETLEASKHCSLYGCCYSASTSVHSYRILIKVLYDFLDIAYFLIPCLQEVVQNESNISLN